MAEYNKTDELLQRIGYRLNELSEDMRALKKQLPALERISIEGR